MEKFPLRLGFLASHNGTDMRAIVGEIEAHRLDAYPAVVISNNSRNPIDENTGARPMHALEFAREHNIPAFQINGNRHEGLETADEAIRSVLLENGVELVIFSGYMKIIDKNSPLLQKRPEGFKGRIINPHPADTKKYGGKGMYGDRVLEAVLEAGDEYITPTIHIVTGPVDEGPILAQGWVKINQDDTVETLWPRVQKVEIEKILGVVRGEIDSRNMQK